MNAISQRNSTFDSRYKFTAKELDNETNYTYFGARYYDSDVSIWLSVDPLSDKYPSLSPYAYCANNPVILVDPDGRDIDPTDETTENALDSYISGFTTNKISGKELFGIVEKDNGNISSSLILSDKKFLKRAEKYGIYGDKQEEALNLYKILMANETVSLRSISEGESQSRFNSKGTPLNTGLEGMPHFELSYNPIMFAPDASSSFATKNSIQSGFSEAQYKSDNWAIPWGDYNNSTGSPIVIFLSFNNNISNDAYKNAFSTIYQNAIPYTNWTQKEYKNQHQQK